MVGQAALEPVQRMTADACPGVLRPHLAADGALVRIRVPGGAVPIATLRGLRDLSDELADGRLGLTSRANMQLRGIAEENVGLLETRLAGLGLLPHPTHERVRNIIASPLSGRSFTSLEDVDPLVAALDAALCARPDLSALPGRFLIGLDDGTGDIAGEEPDVLVRPVGHLGPGRFEIRPGTAPAGVVAGREQVVEAVLTAATAFLVERQRQQSKAWRVRELPGGAGVVVAALVGAGFEPMVDAVGPVDADGPGGGVRAPGLIEQGDGGFAVCAVVPLGILDAEQLEALAACCELALDDDLLDAAALDGPAEGLFDDFDESAPGSPLRITPWRRVVVRDLDLPAALAARELLSAVGLVTAPDAAWARITACAGRPGCAKSLTDVHADARAFAAACAPNGPGIHWAGCERGCGTPHGAVQMFAADGGYRVIGELGAGDRAAAETTSIGVHDETGSSD